MSSLATFLSTSNRNAESSVWIFSNHFAIYGQALNNLGSVYVDCGKLDAAAYCYINALKIGHTRAHQGLACVHFLRNDKNAAYAEMAKLIEKAPYCASVMRRGLSTVNANS